jgi:hypothetical protein
MIGGTAARGDQRRAAARRAPGASRLTAGEKMSEAIVRLKIVLEDTDPPIRRSGGWWNCPTRRI